ncbi:MAG TPA: PilZ domain-containing protein, partial [Archangium sp.]
MPSSPALVPLLRLHYLARARLWSEVVVSGGDRVFVATTEPLVPGGRVQIEIDAPELDAAVLANATVQQVRPLSPGQPAGVLVKLDAESLERCKGLVADHDEAARIAGRAEPRADCDLTARLLAPTVAPGCAVKSLSANGVTLKTPSALTKDLEVRLGVVLPDGTEAQVSAVVMWSRAELALAGLRLVKVDPNTAQRLSEAVEVLLGRRAQGPSLARVVL